MTIAAVDREGQHPWYSEMCSAIIATSWSSGSGDHIHTTDVAWNGVNRCTASHGGTSAAAPLAAGVIALGLSIRPELTWRDVQHIAVRSAVKFNPEDPDWQQTQAGRHFNHKYGYGLIDAYQFVEETKRHKLVNPQAWYESPNITLPATETLITESGTESSFLITEDQLKGANLASLEHVTVRVWITHQRRGDVNVELISPHGTKSALARSRRYDDAMTGFPGWSFMTLKHWDESPIGEWKLRVFDPAHPNKVGNLYAWSISLWGASIDPTKAVPWNFPEDSVEYHESLAAAPETTVIKLPPATATTSAKLKKPTDHLPADHGVAEGESHVDFTNHNGSVPITVQPEADTGYISGLKKNSTWVMVAGGLVVIFAGSLAAFFVMRKRKMGRGSGGGGGRGDGGGGYESLANDEEVAMGELDNGARSSRRGEKSRRTKELYDAFAEGSEDEDEELDRAGAGASGAREGRGLLGRSRGGDADEPYRDDVDDDDDANGDRRFALHDEDADEEEEGETTLASATHENEKDKSAGVATGAIVDILDNEDDDADEDERRSGGSGSGSGGDGSWQDAAEGRDLLAGLGRK